MCMWRFRGVLIAPGIYWHCGCVALRAYLCSGLSGCQLLRRRPSCSWMSTWSSMRRRRSVRKNVTVWTWTGRNRTRLDTGQGQRTVDKRPGGGQLSGQRYNIFNKTQQRCERTSLSGQWTKVAWTNVYCLVPRMLRGVHVAVSCWFSHGFHVSFRMEVY